MVHLILDTNIWIYLAEGQHPFVLHGIIKKADNQDIILLVNDEIIKEWDRNKEESKSRIEKELLKQIDSAKELYTCLEDIDAIAYKELLNKIKKNKPDFLKTIETRFNTVDDLIRNRSVKVPIKKEHKLTVIEWALNQNAPFHRKSNSVADALILISSIDYIKKNGINTVNYNRIDVSDSIFVSYNSDDFSKGVKGEDKDIIHPDLKPYLDSVGMTYERNFGKILNLASDLRTEIDDYMEYVERKIIEQMELEYDIKRGK